MGFRDILLSNPSLIFERNVFYQKDLPRNAAFEKKYIELRKLEHRVYSDEIVQSLPYFSGPLSLKNEWLIRKIMMDKLIKYFKRDNSNLILELGCGNGWLSHQLAISLNAEILGMDINETELIQGASLFNDCQNLSFIRADVFTVGLKKKTFDIILLASSVQYFPNFNQLIRRLLELLKSSGEIHIVDSPFYASSNESQPARKRSDNYFNSQGVPEMSRNYFHHTILDLKSFNHKILSKPNYLISLFRRKVLKIPQNTFPWILIKHS